MKQIDFSDGRVWSNILHSSVPMLLAQVLSLLYSIVDRFFIGRIPGQSEAALAGIGLCFPVIIIITAFTNLFGLGGAPLCSIYRGKGDRASAQKVMNTAFAMLLVTSFAIIILGEMAARPMLFLFGASDVTIKHALPYLRIYLAGTSFAMISTGLNPYINAQGYARTGMLTVVIGSVTNLVLDPVFISACGMGVRGAALATILSQFLSAFFVVRFLRRDSVELRLNLPGLAEFKGNAAIARSIIGLGMASFIMQFTNSMVNMVCNHMLFGIGGDLFVTIMTVVSSVRQILETPVLAVGEGSSPVLSFNYGADRPVLVRRAIFQMSAIMLVYTLVVWRLIELAPRFFIGIFSSDPATLAGGAAALHIYFFAFIFQGLQYAAQTTFKALNMKKRAILFSLFRKAILVIPLTILLPTVFGMGTKGVFLAEPISNLIGGSASFITMLATVMPELRRMDRENAQG